MFEESPSPTFAPKNLPTEPVDMLANTDSLPSMSESPRMSDDALSAGVLKRKMENDPVMAPAQNQPMSSINYEVKNPVLGKILLGVGGLAVVGVLGFGSWTAYKHFFKKPVVADGNNSGNILPIITPTSTLNTPVIIETNTATSSTVVDSFVTTTLQDTSTTVNSDTILFGSSNDNDKDNLDNAREEQIGTNPNSADSDSDGLSDGDEVIFWKTNPLKPDTDGDSYVDGEEVKNGYNPLGPGKLINPAVPTTTTSSTFPTASTSLNTSTSVFSTSSATSTTR